MTEEFRFLQNQLEKEVAIQFYLATLSQETYSRTKSIILDSTDLAEFSSTEIIRFSSMRPKQEEIYAQLYTDILRDKTMNQTFIKTIKTNYTSFSRRIVDLSGILLSAMDFKGDKKNQLPFADLLSNYYTDSDENQDTLTKVTKQWVYEAYLVNTVGHILRFDSIDSLREIYGSTFDVNQRIPNGEFECFKWPTMPLISVAARYGSLKCFKFLLMNKAIMDEETASMAVSAGNWDMVKICEQSKLSFEDASSATQFHRNDFIKWLYKKTHNHVICLTNIESLMNLERIKDKESMLFTLVRNGMFKLAKFYIFNGVKVNILNDGKTLLATAREKKNKKFMKFLLQHGALDDGLDDSDSDDENNENEHSSFYFDPKLLNAYDISEITDNPIYQKAAKVQKLTEDLIKTDNFTDLPSDRLKWLKTFYGTEKAFVPHFNPNDVPNKETFNLKVEQEFQRQVAKGMVNAEYSQAFLTMPQKKEPEKVVVQTNFSEKKKQHYTWFPTGEINAARMMIDTLPHITAFQRQELHRKFGLQVINIISQFDAIGELSDDKITVEQASLLKQTLTDALSEIKKALFKPYGKKALSENREPLYMPRGRMSDDRSIKPLRDKTLGTISDEILKSNGKRETSGPDLGTFVSNLEEVEQFPPEYRPIPNSQLKRFDYESFDKAVEAAKKDILNSGKYKRTERTPEAPKPTRKIKVLSTPRKSGPPKATENLEFKPKKKLPEPPKDEPRKPVTIDKFMAPEVKFFIAAKKGIRVEERPEPDVSYLDKMFTTRPPDEVFQVTAPMETIPLPKFERHKPELKKGNYYLRPNEQEINDLLDTENLFVDEEKPEEHDQLTELWEVLALHPDSRLLMASRLCQIIVNDSTNDYHFKTIKETTKLLVQYKKVYKKIKSMLTYDPATKSPAGMELLMKLIKDMLVTNGSLVHSDKELTHVLGTPLITSKGFKIPEYLQHNNSKLKKLAHLADIDIGNLGQSD